MPMMINGGTGPVLTFQAVTYELSKNMDVPFLTFNAWIGLWVALYMFLSAFFDLNRYIQYATRFTVSSQTGLVDGVGVSESLSFAHLVEQSCSHNNNMHHVTPPNVQN